MKKLPTRVIDNEIMFVEDIDELLELKDITFGQEVITRSADATTLHKLVVEKPTGNLNDWIRLGTERCEYKRRETQTSKTGIIRMQVLTLKGGNASFVVNFKLADPVNKRLCVSINGGKLITYDIVDSVAYQDTLYTVTFTVPGDANSAKFNDVEFWITGSTTSQCTVLQDKNNFIDEVNRTENIVTAKGYMYEIDVTGAHYLRHLRTEPYTHEMNLSFCTQLETFAPIASNISPNKHISQLDFSKCHKLYRIEGNYQNITEVIFPHTYYDGSHWPDAVGLTFNMFGDSKISGVFDMSNFTIPLATIRIHSPALKKVFLPNTEQTNTIYDDNVYIDINGVNITRVELGNVNNVVAKIQTGYKFYTLDLCNAAKTLRSLELIDAHRITSTSDIGNWDNLAQNKKISKVRFENCDFSELIDLRVLQASCEDLSIDIILKNLEVKVIDFSGLNLLSVGEFQMYECDKIEQILAIGTSFYAAEAGTPVPNGAIWVVNCSDFKLKALYDFIQQAKEQDYIPSSLALDAQQLAEFSPLPYSIYLSDSGCETSAGDALLGDGTVSPDLIWNSTDGGLIRQKNVMLHLKNATLT